MKHSLPSAIFFFVCVLMLNCLAWPQADPQNPAATAAQPHAVKSPLAGYAGTWIGSLQGKPFITLRLSLRGDQISGSIQHPKSITTDDNGEIKGFSEDFLTGVVQETKVTGDGLLLTVKDDASNETDRFAMQMTSDTTASLKMLAMSMPPGMAKPKPWKLTKSAAAPPPSASPPRP